MINKIENKKTDKGNKSVLINSVWTFTSIDEFLQTADKCKNPSRMISSDDSEGWHYGDSKEANSWRKTERLLKSGMGLSNVRKLARKYRQEFENSKLTEITDNVKSVKRKRRFNDNDGELDIERVMAGSDDYWSKMRRDGKQKIVRLGINCSISGNNDTKTFSRIVALASVFAELLEYLGYGVEIYGCFLYKPASNAGRDRKYNWIGFQFPVKGATEPLDFDRIYSLGLQGLLRNAKFRVEDVLTGDYIGACYQPAQEIIKLAELDVVVGSDWVGGNEVDQIIKAIDSL